MKKSLTWLFCILVFAVLCACSSDPAFDPVTSEADQTIESTVPEQPWQLVELDISSLGDIIVTALDSNGQYAVIYYTDYVQAGDGDELSAPICEYVGVFSLPENKLVKKIEFQNDDNYWYEVDANEDSFDLVNQ